MQLTHLSLTNFRNFARLDLEVPTGPILLVGENAQGKTSLLEAVYFLATFTSFHASNDRQLINLWAPREPWKVARIVGTFLRFPSSGMHIERTLHRIEARLILDENGANGSPRLRKEVLVDGNKQKFNDAIGVFNAVLFLPQMLRLIDGSPEERRRYLNLIMAQVLPNFVTTLNDFNLILSQRNALLKQINERNLDRRTAGEQLGYWDERLSRIGAEIIFFRIQVIQEIERVATNIHHELSRGLELLRLSYQPSYEPLQTRPGQILLPMETPLDRTGLTIDKIAQGYRDALYRLRSDEIVRGVTLIGPHRDELRFLANQQDLGIYGSRGQIRTAVLAIKLAEVAWMKQRTGQWPVLLLDEVLAELDLFRRKDLLERLMDCEQALMTTTELDLFSPEFIQSSMVWQVHAGTITKELNHESN